MGISASRSTIAKREVLAGPESVVDDDAQLRLGLGGGPDIGFEIRLGMGEVERTGHLDEIGADPLGRLGQPNQFQGAGGLRAHGDRHRTCRLVHHDLGHANTLFEGHGGKIARRAAGQKRGVFGIQSGIDQEPDIGPERRFVHGHVGIVVEGAWEW